MQVAPIARGGLLVVKIGMPFSPTRDCIVIPRYVIHGILTSLHIQLNHPSCHQQQTVVPRYFFALDMDKAIGTDFIVLPYVKRPKRQTTSEPQVAIGISFAADIMRRERQYILVVRECATLYTSGHHYRQ